MKTAVSIPDKLYHKAEKTANKLGISRSKLYARAVEDFLQRHEDSLVREKLDDIYGEDNDTLDRDILNPQSQSIEKEDW